MTAFVIAVVASFLAAQLSREETEHRGKGADE
jgi:hypothetical protein